jgi:hypothetical protein
VSGSGGLCVLFGASVLWRAPAQTVTTYYDSMLHASVQEPWPSDVLYFLGMSVPLTILFIDQKNGFERKQWPRPFYLARAFSIMPAVYLFTFDTPDAWRNGWWNLRADCVDSGNFVRRTAALVV